MREREREIRYTLSDGNGESKAKLLRCCSYLPFSQFQKFFFFSPLSLQTQARSVSISCFESFTPENLLRRCGIKRAFLFSEKCLKEGKIFSQAPLLSFAEGHFQVDGGPFSSLWEDEFRIMYLRKGRKSFISRIKTGINDAIN